MRLLRVFLLATVFLAGARQMAAQEDSTRMGRATISQIAGQNLYLSLEGSPHLFPGDTLALATENAGANHLLLVMAADSVRAVASFAGEPFPLTRGGHVQFVLHPGPRTAPRDARPAVSVAATAAGYTRPPPARPVLVSGRLLLSVDGNHTRTEGFGGDPEVLYRDFATPVAALTLNASHLPGDLEFEANVRASHRFATGDLVQPPTLVRVYELSIAKRFRSAPVAFRVGRFLNPYEYFSGYWDGALLYFGRDRFGIGAVAGFEPKLGNDGFRSEFPKATAFLQSRNRGRGAGYRTDVSFTTVFARDTTPAHSFMGWALDAFVGRTSLSTSLQVDNNPESDKPNVTRLLARISAPAGRHLRLRAGGSIRQPYLLGPTTDVIPFRRDRATGGLTVTSGGASINADVTWNQQDGLSSFWSYSGGLYLPRAMADFSLGLTANYWSEGSGSNSTGLTLGGRLRRRFGQLDTGFGYQYFRSETLGRSDGSHLFDFNLIVPLSRRTRASIRARTRQGQRLTSGGIYASLWMTF